MGDELMLEIGDKLPTELMMVPKTKEFNLKKGTSLKKTNTMKVAPRGRYQTVVHDDNSPVTIVFATTISTAPRVRDSKTYVSVLCDDPRVVEVDTFIKQQQPNIEYSPLRGHSLILKLAPKALVDPDLAVFDEVMVHAKLGNFGSFGYCWIATNIFRAPSNV